MSYQDVRVFFDQLLAASSPTHPAWNQEVLLGHIKPSWNYIDGCMMKAVLELYYSTKERRYLDFADSYVDYFIA